MVGRKELRPEDYLRILRRRWPLLLVLAAMGGVAGYVAAHFLPKRYTSQTVVLVQQPTVPGDYVKPVVSQDVTQRMAAMQQQILSRTRLEPIMQQFGLYRKEAGRVPVDQLVENLRKAITVSPVTSMAGTGGGLPGFSVSVTLEDARLAQQVCSSITSMFMEKNLQLRQQQAEDTTDFLGKQLEGAKAKLDDQDSRLAEFKRRYAGSLPDEAQTTFNVLAGLTSQLEATRDALNRAQQDKTYIESTLSQQLDNWKSAPAGQSPETLDHQLAALQQKLEGLHSKYTDNYPDVVNTEADIADLKREIAASKNASTSSNEGPAEHAAEPPQIQQSREQIRQLTQVIQERTAEQQGIQQKINVYEARVQSIPGIEQQYKELTRDYQTALDFYTDLLRKRTQSAMGTDLERRQEGEQFLVLDPANLPEGPSFPNNRLFAFGGFAGGIGLGLALAYFFEIQDSSLRSEHDVESTLHLTVLATIPAMASKPSRTKTRFTELDSSARKRA
jgi:polysaccharide chain length determinant protein (PEP-CTERM system associated)